MCPLIFTMQIFQQAYAITYGDTILCGLFEIFHMSSAIGWTRTFLNKLKKVRLFPTVKRSTKFCEENELLTFLFNLLTPWEPRIRHGGFSDILRLSFDSSRFLGPWVEEYVNLGYIQKISDLAKVLLLVVTWKYDGRGLLNPDEY